VDALLVAVLKSLVAQPATAAINHSLAHADHVNALIARLRRPARLAAALHLQHVQYLLHHLLNLHVPAKFANAKTAAVNAIAKPATAQIVIVVRVIAAAPAPAVEASSLCTMLVDCSNR
jgi:hypothetical protein